MSAAAQALAGLAPNPTTGPVLDIRGLTKRYPNGVLANDRLSFAVGAGEVVGLLGHNGAGKTTLVRAVGGQLRPTAGTIRVCGQDVVARPDQARIWASIQAQAQVPITGLTPRQAIYLIGRLRGGARRPVLDRVDELADRLDIAEWLDRRSRPGNDTLTGGVLRLVAFAMATVAPAPLIVLDEPTNDVDPVRRRYLWSEIRRLADLGHAVVLVTHNVVEAERSLDRVLLLHRGRLILDGAPSALLSDVGRRLRVLVTWEPGRAESLPGYLSDAGEQGRSQSALVEPDRLADVLAWGNARRQQGSIEHFTVATPNLEDVYVRAVDAEDREREAAPGTPAQPGGAATLSGRAS